MGKHTKLELTWIGKDDRPRLEPRILIEDPEKSYHAPHRVSEHDIFDNISIHGDNLLALKALEQEFTGKIKCIFIDPPYNTGSAFTHYEDGLEHSIWLSLMRDRLELLRKLLAPDGSIWVSIDDNECHYLKILMDEIWGRKNFVANIIWQKKYAPANDAIWLSDSHDHILVFAKDKATWRPCKLVRTEKANSAYKNPDNDPRGPWKAGDYTCAKTANERPNLYYPIRHPSTGAEIWPNSSRVWAYSREQHEQHVHEGLLWWGKKGTNKVPAFKRFLSTVNDGGTVAQTIWLWEEVGHTQDGRKEQLNLTPNDPFPTPKPEALLKRVMEPATQEDDWVLDSFAGSGTTGAVAHKMGRRWIMVELGEHCHTHIIPRLRKVIDGKDPNPAFNAAMLAEAMCKLERFTYAPSEDVFWRHGHSTEQDFIYITTQFMSKEMLTRISDEVGPDRSLLIYCTAFRCDPNQFPNLTLKKIPNAVLARCEWGKDDYSLAVANLAPQPVEPGTQPSLFEDAEP